MMGGEARIDNWGRGGGGEKERELISLLFHAVHDGTLHAISMDWHEGFKCISFY